MRYVSVLPNPADLVKQSGTVLQLKYASIKLHLYYLIKEDKIYTRGEGTNGHGYIQFATLVDSAFL